VEKSDTPNALTSRVSMPLTPPGTGGWTHHDLSGTAVIQFTSPLTGDLVTETVTQFGTAFGLRGSITVEWRGAALAADVGIAFLSDGVQEIFFFVLDRIG
jgi:hypothetical protein